MDINNHISIIRQPLITSDSPWKPRNPYLGIMISDGLKWSTYIHQYIWTKLAQLYDSYAESYASVPNNVGKTLTPLSRSLVRSKLKYWPTFGTQVKQKVIFIKLNVSNADLKEPVLLAETIVRERKSPSFGCLMNLIFRHSRVEERNCDLRSYSR